MLEAGLDGLFRALFRMAAVLIHWVRLVPTWVLAAGAWAIALLALWNLYATSRDTLKRTQQMHQIPCANCQFFTHDYRLKCTVHPQAALTESAIGCRDFEKAREMAAYVPSHSHGHTHGHSSNHSHSSTHAHGPSHGHSEA